MAKRNQKEQGTHPEGGDAEALSSWQEALLYVRQNPARVAGGAGFLLLCIAIGGLFSLKNIAEAHKDNTRYATADAIKEPSERAEALEEIANESSRWQAEARYKAGEAFIEAKAYDKAREAFEKLLAEHGDSEYAPMAADGLAFLNENDGKLEEALQGYTEVFEKWDDTFTGLREPYNIGRVLEALGKPAEAIEHYQKQVEIFPGSSVARKSQAALARLKAKNPELFPEEEQSEEKVAGTSENGNSDASNSDDTAATAGDATTPKKKTTAVAPASESTAETPTAKTVENPATESSAN